MLECLAKSVKTHTFGELWDLVISLALHHMRGVYIIIISSGLVYNFYNFDCLTGLVYIWANSGEETAI